MGRLLKNLIGQRFGRLTVIERAENKGKQTCWRCKCDCGNEVVVSGGNLRNGGTKSCGCFLKEGNHKTHGMSCDPIFNVWRGMIRRTTDPKHKGYKNYGRRGIKICERWLVFENFRADVSKLEHFNEDGYTLDRIDNNGDYYPENVRWASRKTQNRNKSSNTIVEYQGRKITLIELSEITGIKYPTLEWRYHRGDRGERLIRPIETKYRNK